MPRWRAYTLPQTTLSSELKFHQRLSNGVLSSPKKMFTGRGGGLVALINCTDGVNVASPLITGILCQIPCLSSVTSSGIIETRRPFQCLLRVRGPSTPFFTFSSPRLLFALKIPLCVYLIFLLNKCIPPIRLTHPPQYFISHRTT